MKTSISIAFQELNRDWTNQHNSIQSANSRELEPRLLDALSTLGTDRDRDIILQRIIRQGIDGIQ